MTTSKPVILITGCSSGIGALAVGYFLKAGYRVAATVRQPADQRQLQQTYASFQKQLLVLQMDVCEQASIDAMCDAIMKRWQRIDVLINNAGCAYGGAFEDLPEAMMQAQFEVNFFGVQRVTRAILPMMRAQGQGKIINVSSIAGLLAFPYLGAYAATKWALDAFTESLRHEVWDFGIQVCGVHPAAYRSRIFDHPDRLGPAYQDQNHPYHQQTKTLIARINDHKAHYQDPLPVIKSLDRVIMHPHPPLRNFPDGRSWLIYLIRKFLPGWLNDWILRFQVCRSGLSKPAK